jgi:hypothetical protein
MGHQSRHAPIAIEEWMHPQQAVVGRRRDDRLGLPQVSVDLLEPFEEAR